MTTPAQSAIQADSARPRWQVLLSRTLLRLRVAAAARRGLWALLILAAAYGLFLLTIRLTGLVHWKPEALLLAALPAVAVVLGLAWPRRPTLRDAARAVDRQARTEDLFLTMLLLENTPGEYQPLVAAQAEAKAARIRAAEVAPPADQWPAVCHLPRHSALQRARSLRAAARSVRSGGSRPGGREGIEKTPREQDGHAAAARPD